MGDIAVPFFMSTPAAPPPWPGVIVVMEGNGISPQLLRVCERLAAAGYAAVAPDLFAFFGGSDEWIPRADVTKVEAHHAGDVIIYEDAQHGFMRDVSDTYHETA